VCAPEMRVRVKAQTAVEDHADGDGAHAGGLGLRG